MDVFIPVLTGIGLSMDCLAVSLAIGASGTGDRLRTAITVGLFFGFFQLVMPLAGYFGGQAFMGFISSFDHLIAFGILAGIGGKMIYEALSPDGRDKSPLLLTLPALLVLSLATSIDALGVGLSFAFAGIDIILSCAVIGLIAFLLSVCGVMLGNRLGDSLGNRVEMIGGIILIAIGFRILMEHTGYI
jgi:putative Mn2+ efflux pump MntP